MRFGTESAVSLTVAGQGGAYSGPPRLIAVGPDPADRRARIVTRTPAGDEIKAMTERAIAAMEGDWAEHVGAERYRVFKEVLNELALG